MEDLLVASENEEQHEQHLREIFTRLQLHGLVLNGEKCVLGVSQVEYLGHLVTASGIKPLEERVAAIRDFPRPENSKALQRSST